MTDQEKKEWDNLFAAFGIFTLIVVLILILGYIFGFTVLIVIGWIGVGIIVLGGLFIGYAWLDSYL